jgi:GxxExxY protein
LPKFAKANWQSGEPRMTRQVKTMKPILIMIHGWTKEGSDSFSETIKFLKDDFEIYLIDLPGFKNPLERPYDLNDYLNYLETRIDTDITRINTDDGKVKIHQTRLLYSDLTYKIRSCLFKVYNTIGSGHKEIVYKNALAEELRSQNVKYTREPKIEIKYVDKLVGFYMPDFIIDDKIILEIKAKENLIKEDIKQSFSYLKATKYNLLILINFGIKELEIKRIINTPEDKDYQYKHLKNQRRSVSPNISVDRCMNQCRSASFYLLGHSFGGALAMLYALKHPEKIKKLILYNPAIIREKKLKVKISLFLSKIFKFLEKFIPEKIFYLPKKAYYKFIIKSYDYFNADENLKKTFANIVKIDLRDLAKNLKVKTILLWSKNDKITPLRHGEILKNLIPDSEIILLNGGHSFHKEKPEEFAKILKEVLG